MYPKVIGHIDLDRFKGKSIKRDVVSSDNDDYDESINHSQMMYQASLDDENNRTNTTAQCYREQRVMTSIVSNRW